MIEYDELAAGAPEWYAPISAALGRDKKEEAMRLAREALTKCRDASDRRGEMLALRQLARGHIGKGDAWKGRQYAGEANDIAKSLGDRKAEAAGIHLLAKVHIKEKALDTAVKVSKEAIEMFKAQNDRAAEAAVTNTLAQAHMAEDQSDLAAELAQEAFNTFKELDQKQGQVSVLHTLVQIKLRENRCFNALIIIKELTNLYVDLGDLRGEGSGHLLATEVYLLEGNLGEAMDSASMAVDLFERANDLTMKAKALNAMVRAFGAANQPKDAVEIAETALQIYQHLGNKRGQAEVLATAADFYAAAGQRDKQVSSLVEASNLYKSCKEKIEAANALAKASKANATMMQENPAGFTGTNLEMGVQLCRSAVAAFVELGGEHMKSEVYAYALASLGVAHQVAKDGDQAIARTEEAIELFQELGSLAGEGFALFTLAIEFASKDAYDDAQKMGEKAYDLLEETEETALFQKVKQGLKSFGFVKAQMKTDKTGQTSAPTDITYNRIDGTPFMIVDSFQGRATTVAAPRGSSSSIAIGDTELTADDFLYRAPLKKPVLFTIKWHKWARPADRNKLLIAESDRHLIIA